MVIEVLGNTINTDHISRITKIQETNREMISFDFAIFLKDGTQIMIRLSPAIMFTTVKRDYSKDLLVFYNSREMLSSKEYLKELHKIENIRTRIVQVWSGIKDISKFTFDD